MLTLKQLAASEHFRPQISCSTFTLLHLLRFPIQKVDFAYFIGKVHFLQESQRSAKVHFFGLKRTFGTKVR